ncbi:hypothetical protein GALMADRAFT_155880 [Galerina marginata CBS 339.88]|uniref:Uncharacterized protein n=1 Tax=Galerina marginata (strain CBS 339.88) TaxID=685588 RepID=A0A067T282_GALM3|nr:hypothetical protein GALMADRAFT_155880 [Galerina marginata CBS 339.88]
MPKEFGPKTSKAKKMVRRALHKSLDELPPDSTKNSFTNRIVVAGSGNPPSSMGCFGVSGEDSRTHLIQAVDDIDYREMQRLDRQIRVLQSTSESNPLSHSNVTRHPGRHSSSTTAGRKSSRMAFSRASASYGSGGMQEFPSLGPYSYPSHCSYPSRSAYPSNDFQGFSSYTPGAEGAAPYTRQLPIREAQITHHAQSAREFAFDAYQAEPFYPGYGSSTTMMGDNVKIGLNPGYPQQPPVFGLPNYPNSHAVPFTGSSYPTEVASHGTELTSCPHTSESDLIAVNQFEDNTFPVDHSVYFSVPQNLDEQPDILYPGPPFVPAPLLQAIYRSPNYTSNGDEVYYHGSRPYQTDDVRRFF